MANFISEDDIEQAVLEKLAASPLNYNIIRCSPDPDKRNDLNDGTGRANKKECVLPDILLSSLRRINPDIHGEHLTNIAKDLRRDFSNTDIVDTNYKRYNEIRNGITIKTRKNGKEDFDIVKLIDFENPENNTFTAVSQMWIQGKIYYRRPDILIFINGLPLVFIELKNSPVKLREAYNKNLTDYLRDIPNLFAFNQICVLSNGLQTKLGAFNATYDHFFSWLKIQSENEIIDKKALENAERAQDSSIKYFVDGLLNKTRLLDYIENFILFQNQSTKLIAKNHQFLGVNNLIESVKNRKQLKGKLGVFWHTQGSGKSYSMVMFARKVRRKIPGNFTFLIITDREDLDTQIHKNFVRTEVIGAKEETQPKNAAQLREYLQTNKTFIFTLIHKFHYDKEKRYPTLTTRDDIIVLVDEAHRTQYKDLAENMRIALPNANYIAFTGTPLLGSKRLTNQWFGNYVSEYNFAQSIADGSTVPLYYSRRVPEVWLTNNFLDNDILRIIEDENLNDEEIKRLENTSAKILEVIKREDRLDKIAQDIANHFPTRGFLGKGMVVSVDKFTAVKMYEKVQHYWTIEKQKLIQQRNTADTNEKRDELTRILDYMERVEMAVIISEEANEDKKFQKIGLDISYHRGKMNAITTDGKDIEDRFKDPNDPLQLVFVCAMWLTGFDVQNLSTLYLDKPMKGHTLMQAIARANRVYPGKQSGTIVDYVNVFKYMKEALSDYATGGDGTEYPIKDIQKLIAYIEDTIEEADRFLTSLGIDLNAIIQKENTKTGSIETLNILDDLRNAYSIIIQKDDTKEKFKVITNLLLSLHDAAMPEISEMGWKNQKYTLIKYLYKYYNGRIDDEKLENARKKMANILDISVEASDEIIKNHTKPQYEIRESKEIDLSKIDFDELRKEIKTTPYKAIQIEDIRTFIEKTLEKMLNKNCTRDKFSERFKRIIDNYNAGNTENETYYELLIQLVEDLKQESERANLEGLTEEELEIFDLLMEGKKLSKEDEKKVKLSAKNLFKKLTEEKDTLLVVDWYKDDQPKARVKSAIEESLDHDLPQSYDVASFQAKVDKLMSHFVDMAVQGYGWIAEAA